MQVRIGNEVFDSGDQPVSLVLNENERDEIGALSTDALLYASFPVALDAERVLMWAQGELSHDALFTG